MCLKGKGKKPEIINKLLMCLQIYRGCYSMSPFVDMLKGIKLQGEKNQTLLRHHNP